MPPKKKGRTRDEGQGGEEEVFEEITQVLDDHDLEFEQDVVVGSTSADFYLVAPSGSTAVLEVKLWQPTEENQERASHLATLYQRTSGADRAYVMIPGLSSSNPEAGVVSGSEIQTFVEEQVAKAPKTRRRKLPEVQRKPGRYIFAAMPFADKYDDTYLVAMKPAALDIEADCVRVDHGGSSGDIVTNIKSLIANSIAVIADLSESKPNVLFELGFADASGRPSVQICSTDLGNLPFNVRNSKTLKYSIGRSSRLKWRLVEQLKNVLG